jgi:hypothetical protein
MSTPKKFLSSGGFFRPAGADCLLGTGAPLFVRHTFSSGHTALEATFATQGNGRRVLSPFLWRGLAILDFAAGDIDHQLSELGWVAGALESVLWHDATMRQNSSGFQGL